MIFAGRTVFTWFISRQNTEELLIGIQCGSSMVIISS